MAKNKYPLISKEAALANIKKLTDKHIKQIEEENPIENGVTTEQHEEVIAILRHLYESNGIKNIEILSKFSESIIETQFYLSLAILLYGYFPTSLYIPTQHENELYQLGLSAKEKEDAGVKLTKKERQNLLYIDFYEMTKNSIIAFPQCYLEELNGGRVDLLLKWGGRELVVECDGYEWHQSKEQFAKDRQRDRILVSAGYEVMRFTGKELLEDVAKCVIEVADHIFKKWGFYEADIS